MIQEQEKEINGAKYRVQQFAARRGLGLKTRLIKLIAPTVLAVMGNQGQKVNLDNIDPALLGKGIQGLLDNLDSDSVIKLVFDLLVNTWRDGVQVTSQNGTYFDSIYAGNYAELYKALLFVVEVNFGSFFQELGIGSREQSQTQPSQEIIRGKL